MAADVSSVYRVLYNDGGFLPDTLLLTLCNYIGEPLQYHEEFLSRQPIMFLRKIFRHFFH